MTKPEESKWAIRTAALIATAAWALLLAFSFGPPPKVIVASSSAQPAVLE